MNDTVTNPPTTITDEHYRQILKFRTQLRYFLHWSEQEVRSVGLTPNQYQLLLAIRGHPDKNHPTVSDIANYLFLKHHSAVGLIDRAEKAGLVKRIKDPDDHRITRLSLSTQGDNSLVQLASTHIQELREPAKAFPQFNNSHTE